MPQFARPDADITSEGYVDEGGEGTNLFQKINETSANDATSIRSPVGPETAAYVCQLSTVSDPASSSGHIVRYRYGKDAALGGTIDQTVELRQGYVNEGALGTLIASWVHSNVGVGPLAAAQTLSGPQADAITNYGDLYLRVISDQV